MDKELATLKRGFADLYEDQQVIEENLPPQPRPGRHPSRGTRHTKRQYDPPSLICQDPANADADNCNRDGGATIDSDAASDDCQPPHVWTAGDAACSREGETSLQQTAGGCAHEDGCSAPWDTWGHPTQAAAPLEGGSVMGIPMAWLGWGPHPSNARLGGPQPAVPLSGIQPAVPEPGIHKWWKELDERCPTEVAEEANRQLMHERNEDSRARHRRNQLVVSRGKGGLPIRVSTDGKGKGTQPGHWDPMVVVRQMEDFVHNRTFAHLPLPNMRLKRKNLVDRIACLFHLEWRTVQFTPLPEDPGASIKPKKAYFATEHTKPLSESGQMLLEQILEDWRTGKKGKAADWKPHWKRGPWKGEKKGGKHILWQLREDGSSGDVAAVAQTMQPLKPAWGGGWVDVKQEASDRLVAGMLQPLQEDNKGSQMLVGMGWQQGQGIGARQQGMLEPVGVTQRRRGQGLGSE